MPWRHQFAMTASEGVTPRLVEVVERPRGYGSVELRTVRRQLRLQAFECGLGHTGGIDGGLQHRRRHGADQHRLCDAAFTMSAELFLMQHSCHWYCKSKTVASARMLARHQTSYEQLLDAVSPETRSAYAALTGQ